MTRSTVLQRFMKRPLPLAIAVAFAAGFAAVEPTGRFSTGVASSSDAAAANRVGPAGPAGATSATGPAVSEGEAGPAGPAVSAGAPETTLT